MVRPVLWGFVRLGKGMAGALSLESQGGCMPVWGFAKFGTTFLQNPRNCEIFHGKNFAKTHKILIGQVVKRFFHIS